jgi:hypothetical protein
MLFARLSTTVALLALAAMVAFAVVSSAHAQEDPRDVHIYGVPPCTITPMPGHADMSDGAELMTPSAIMFVIPLVDGRPEGGTKLLIWPSKSVEEFPRVPYREPKSCTKPVGGGE